MWISRFQQKICSQSFNQEFQWILQGSCNCSGLWIHTCIFGLNVSFCLLQFKVWDFTTSYIVYSGMKRFVDLRQIHINLYSPAPPPPLTQGCAVCLCSTLY